MLKIWIERDPLSGEYGIYIGEKKMDRLFMAKPQEIEMVEVKDCKPFKQPKSIKPFLKIGGIFGHNFLHELSKALSKFGIKDDRREEELESVLKAKEFHLEDMRSLVFKKK